MRATDKNLKTLNQIGDSQTLTKSCYILIQNAGLQGSIYQKILPDISDSKSASYADESAIGRSMPFKTYQYSENRTISWTAHFLVEQKSDIEKFFGHIRAIESAVYPDKSDKAPYIPPPLCELRCGGLLSGSGAPLLAVLKSYSIKFDTSVPWDRDTLLPYKFDIDMQFDVVYNQSDLPNSSLIWGLGGPGAGYGKTIGTKPASK
jgi:hypothetical protein